MILPRTRLKFWNIWNIQTKDDIEQANEIIQAEVKSYAESQGNDQCKICKSVFSTESIESNQQRERMGTLRGKCVALWSKPLLPDPQ